MDLCGILCNGANGYTENQTVEDAALLNSILCPDTDVEKRQLGNLKTCFVSLA